MATLTALRRTLARATRLARHAATGPGAWLGIAIYVLILTLSFVEIWFSVRLTTWQRDFYNALENRELNAALRQVAVWGLLVVGGAGVYLVKTWFNSALHLRWRRHLTGAALNLWLGRRGYWQMRKGYGATAIDNPDQRLAEDCNKFVEYLLLFTLDLISEAVALVSYLVVLWGLATFVFSFTLLGFGIEIPRYMVWLAFVYVLASSVLAHLLGHPLKGLYFARERTEADFRHALVQLRDNADTVALSQGEAAERRRLDQHFEGIAGNWRQVMNAEFRQGLFGRFYSMTVLRLPIIFALPAYFGSQMTLGGLMQIAMAFSNVSTTLSWFIFNYKKLAEFVAVCERLDGLMTAARDPAPLPGAPRELRRTAGTGLRLRGLRLATPDGRWLDPVPDQELPAGARLWIAGRSGIGKTTLLSALSGLWPWGKGRIDTPDGRLMVLPAGAPVFPGGLAAAACYPDDPASHDPARLRHVLERLGLGHRLEGDDVTGLSMGERQRIGLARAVMLRPDWLLLDESTSALDPVLEAELLAWLDAELPDTTILIVSHRRPTGLRLDATLRIGAQEDQGGVLKTA